MLVNVNIIDKDFNITDFKKISCIKIKLIKNIVVGVKHIKKFFALKI